MALTCTGTSNHNQLTRHTDMVNTIITIQFTIAALAVLDRASAARILGVFPHHGYSHHMVFLPYLQTLADRGHDVYVISNFDSSHPNITDISVRGSMPMANNNVTFPTSWALDFSSSWTDTLILYEIVKTTEGMFNVPAVKRLLDDQNASFDLVIAEHFNSELPIGFAAKYRAPFVLLSSCSLLPWTMPLVGQPLNTAYVPSTFSGMSARMHFVQRFINTLMSYASVFVFRIKHRSWSQKTLKKHLGMDISLNEFALNASLVLVNTHWSISGVLPTVPAVLEVGGMHVKVPKQLPQDIQKYIDEAEHGVIYFCMGSLLRGETFPAEKRQMFLNVFNKIPQRILWKWEGDELPGKPSNVMIRKWMPQRDIFAHPNVKLFISHGGLLGTTEAVYEGVPILAMPIFGDQMTNMKAVVDKGAAEIMYYKHLNEDEISLKVISMLTNPIYKQKAKELSDAFRDRPMSPLETAVYWTEYVIRHNGAPHLRSAAVGMPWYQYYLVDVLSVILLSIATIFVMLYYFICKVFFRLKSKKFKEKQT